LRREVALVLGTPAVRARLREVGLEDGPADPAMAEAMLRAEVGRWATLVHEAGIQAD
jgi:tripartite-type tricarboxylate transporter receptor subunit TctC